MLNNNIIPNAIDEKEYCNYIKLEFDKLLKDNSNDESKFQTFFEKNPCYLPGPHAEFDFGGPSGHGPHLNTLISQPKINGIVRRNPDFLWFAYDSGSLIPIFIEIEAPSKKIFNKNGTCTAKFTQAKNQLDEWKTILSRPENVTSFLRTYNLPESISDLYFEPYYILIYGRRTEFENNTWLKQKRGQLLSKANRQILMSYDRLQPRYSNGNFISSTIKEGTYKAKYLMPTFQLNPNYENLLEFSNLNSAIDKMEFTSIERKAYLKEMIEEIINKPRTEDDE